MLELLFSALITILPDYLYRTRVQGKKLGQEITLFSFYYELRWGIAGCVILSLILLTVIFYFHPTTSSVTSLFRTVTILSDTGGRVEEVYVSNNQHVSEGDPIFRLDTRRQRAAAETALRRIAEIDASLVVAQSDLTAAEGAVTEAKSGLARAMDDLTRREEIAERNPNVVSDQELDSLRTAVAGREGALATAEARVEAVRGRITSLLPAQRASAEAALAQAQTEIEKATVVAGTDGVVRQFKLKPGDIVNPILRPAGLLVPSGTGVGVFQAGFGQISAQVLRPGMIAEITCASKPLEVIPMVITEVQTAIAGGQFRPTDQLVDIQDRARPGTVLAVLEPLHPGHADAVPPGSVCRGVAYSNHAPAIEAGDIGGFSAFLARIVDGMGIANAIVIRGQALLLPVWALVFAG